jgi:glycosyltransferase involved in cell wall biosynthesis
MLRSRFWRRSISHFTLKTLRFAQRDAHIMKIGLIIYGSLDTLSGGYLYDRKLVEYLRAQGDTVEIISLPWRNYAAHLTDNFWFSGQHPQGTRAVRLQKFDILIQDELNHPSLIAGNIGKHPCPIISLVHHLRCSELRPKWQNDLYRVVEKKYLQSVDGFIFNSKTTKGVVNSLIGNNKPSVIAYPPTDRFGDAISEEEIRERATSVELKILFLGNVIERKGLHTLLEAIRLLTFNFQLSTFNLQLLDCVRADSRLRPDCARRVPARFHSDGLPRRPSEGH